MKRVLFLLCAATLCVTESPFYPVKVNAQTTVQERKVDVNDISFLWPVPTTVADVNKLIRLSEKTPDGESLWPKAVFDKVMVVAKTVSVEDSAGRPNVIEFGNNNDPAFFELANWRIVGVRVDPSAPGCSEKTRKQFGSFPQIRLIAQPVMIHNGNRIEFHDVAAHLVFSYATRQDGKGVPQEEKFREILEDLLKLKALALEKNVETAGDLSVHPALAKNVEGFSDGLEKFLKKHLRGNRLSAVSFMGLAPRPEPWVFFAMVKTPAGYRVMSLPQVGGKTAQMLSFRGGRPVMPQPTISNWKEGKGVSTARLFDGGFDAEEALFEDPDSPKNRDIPDFVANPTLAHFFNTDCVSCHTESSLRSSRNFQSEKFRFAVPEGISRVQPELLPNSSWNVRNFGWFVLGSGPTARASVSMRTSNEAAETAHFINHHYLGEKPVSNPLTLLMKIKAPLDTNTQKLKVFVGQNQKKIREAMTKLGTVHYARFVIHDGHLMIITTYDNDFDAYVQQFIDEIGDIFDGLMQFVEDAPPTPVANHPEEFSKFIERNNAKGTFYSAYPNLKVLDILTLEKESEERNSTP